VVRLDQSDHRESFNNELTNDKPEGKPTVKPVFKMRRAFLTSFIIGSTLVSTGCSTGSGFSLASMNPFSRSEPSPEYGPEATPGMTDSLASAATGAKQGISAVGASTRKAVGATTNAVVGVFRRPTETVDETDPLSLSNKTEKVGADVYVANGQLWESSGDLTKALESYNQALESEPNNAPALASIARLHFRQGKYQEANQFFTRALTQSPQDAELHNDLALTRSKLNDVPGSVSSFNQALALSPGTSRYANNLATVHFESGDAASAYRVLAANNKPAVAHFNMAYLYYKSGRLDEAKRHLNSAVEFAPQGSTDAIVQRAVDRSREMLTQIESGSGAATAVAQAAPQATIAGGQFFHSGPQTAPVQQTGRAEPTSTAAPSSTGAAPATQAITPPPTWYPTGAPTTANPPSATPTKVDAKPVRPAAAVPAASTPAASPPASTMPAPTVTKPAASAADTSGPGFPFSLPSGFQPQN
jgi:Flp pilus assembly protein TadD